VETSDGNYSSIRIFDHSNISIRCYNTIRNENYSSFKFSCNTKRLIIIGIVASNTDIRIFKLFTADLFEFDYSKIYYIFSGNYRFVNGYNFYHNI
jgi:hypothetical protein